MVLFIRCDVRVAFVGVIENYTRYLSLMVVVLKECYKIHQGQQILCSVLVLKRINTSIRNLAKQYLLEGCNKIVELYFSIVCASMVVVMMALQPINSTKCYLSFIEYCEYALSPGPVLYSNSTIRVTERSQRKKI